MSCEKEALIVEKAKEKQVVSDNASLIDEWNWERNSNDSPMQLTVGSHKKVWWKCHDGHEWQAEIKSRYYGKGCPYCSGRYAIKGINDLQTVNPSLASEWDYEKNDGLIPEDVMANSGKKVWWKCSKGHEWQAVIAHRNTGSGCPYCSGQKVLKGFNDLQTVNPSLASEWNYERNGDLKPEDVTSNNGKKVWWKCIKGHEWQAKIYHRNNGSNCPICSSERNTSFPEYAILYYLEKYGLGVVHSYKDNGYELDIYMPAQKTAVEYDGYYWHKNKTDEDLEKNRRCVKDGIRLFRIREGLPSLNDSSIDYVIQKDQKSELAQVIEKLIVEILGIYPDINLKRDSISIESKREYMEKDSSILSLNPQIADEWDYERNGNLKPDFFASNSGKVVWWKCNKGHEWQSTIQNRNKGSGCPYCAGRIAISGENDLQTVNPDLAGEWVYEKNGGLTPLDVLPNSDKRAWWRCSKGHEWQSTIGNRTKGNGCPYCSGKKVLKGFNDLQTVNPSLASEWNYEKNGDLTPESVTSNSNKSVWWKCNKGHEWKAIICDRNRGNGCPYCSGKRVLKGFNDLQTVNPSLASEWNYEKNGDLTPENVTPNSNKSVWWKCHLCNHEWRTSVSNRNNQNTGCPKCVKKRVAKAISRKVIQLSLDHSVITEFCSVAEAERQTGIKHIASVCRGEREKAGGYLWEYAE